MRKFILKKFRPSYKMPFGSALAMLVTSIAGGLIIGGIVGFVAQYIYLIYLFPLIMGAVAGLLLATVVRRGKVRNPVITVLFSILTAMILYGTYQFASYYLDRQKIVDQIMSTQGVDNSTAQDAFDRVLNKDVGTTGFVGYLEFTAKQGIRFSSVGSSSGSDLAPIQGNIVYGYWLLEFLGIALIAAVGGARETTKPFCETCGNWYRGTAFVGNVDRKSSKQFVKALRQGDFSQAKLFFIPPTRPPRTDLIADYCKTCNTSDVILTAKRVVYVRRNRTNSPVIIRGVVSHQQFADLMPASSVKPAAM